MRTREEVLEARDLVGHYLRRNRLLPAEVLVTMRTLDTLAWVLKDPEVDIPFTSMLDRLRRRRDKNMPKRLQKEIESFRERHMGRR